MLAQYSKYLDYIYLNGNSFIFPYRVFFAISCMKSCLLVLLKFEQGNQIKRTITICDPSLLAQQWIFMFRKFHIPFNLFCIDVKYIIKTKEKKMFQTFWISVEILEKISFKKCAKKNHRICL